MGKIIFQHTYSSSELQVAQQLRIKVGTHTGQDALPSKGALTHPHPHPHSLTLRQCRHASSPHMHIFGTWEETGVPGENPCGPGENKPIHADSGPS